MTTLADAKVGDLVQLTNGAEGTIIVAIGFDDEKKLMSYGVKTNSTIHTKVIDLYVV